MICETEIHGQYFLRMLFTVCIGIAVASLITYLSYNSQLGLASGILFILVGLFPFARAWIKRDFDAFEIINIFILYMILGIGIRGLVGIYCGTTFWFFDPASEGFDITRLKVFTYSTIALLSLYIGYYSGLGNRWINVMPRLNFDWQRTRAFICLVIFLLISGTSVVLFIIKFGSWEGMESFGRQPGQYQGQVMVGGMTHITAFMRFFWVVFFVSCIYLFSKNKTIWVYIIFLLCLFGISFAFINFGGKATFLMAVLGYVIARHYLKRMISAKIFFVLIIIIFILSPFLWHIRAYGIYRWDILKDTYISAISDPMEFVNPLLRRSYSFDSFALFIEATDSGKDFELGSTMTDLFYFFIPRAWWPGKPLPFTVTFLPKYANMYSPGSMAPSLPGELYMNFHVIGVILGFLLLGVLMKICYKGLIRRNFNKSSLLVYIPVVLTTPLLFEGGINKIEEYMLTLFPVILFLWIVKSKG